MWHWLFRWFAPRSTDSVSPLVRQSRSADADTRQQAASQLATVGEAWAGSALVQLLADSHSAIRSTARASLLQLGEPAVPALIDGLKHASVDIARTSAELLGELRVASAVPALLVALKFAGRPAQLAARRALVRIGPAAVAALEAMSAEPNPWVLQQVRESLDEIRVAHPAP